MAKYKRTACSLHSLAPRTERLPSLSAARGTTYNYFESDDRRDAPDYIHLAEATVHYNGSTRDVRFWRGRLSAVSSFWTE